MTPSDPACYSTDAGFLRHKPSPLGRREEIRLALELGDWRQAAAHLHQAHTHQEWRGCGLSSWTEYVETIPLSRMHDWRLRLIHRTGTTEAGYNYRQALAAALAAPRTVSH